MRSIRLAILSSVMIASIVLLFNSLLFSGRQVEDSFKALTIMLDEMPWPEVINDSLTLIANEGVVYYASTPFTGYAVEYFDNGKLALKAAYVMGKREGQMQKWYPSGTMSFSGIYVQNRRHGVVKTWWQNGAQRSESNYVDGVPHGVQRQWYQSGALFKELNLAHGKEAGLQRAWRENGKLYANYEAIDGRIFGLKRANLCYDLDGETIKLRSEASS